MAVCSVAIVIDTAHKSIAERTDECWSEGIRIVYCRGIAILRVSRLEPLPLNCCVPKISTSADWSRVSLELDKQMLFVADGMVDTRKQVFLPDGIGFVSKPVVSAELICGAGYIGSSALLQHGRKTPTPAWIEERWE